MEQNDVTSYGLDEVPGQEISVEFRRTFFFCGIP